MIPVAHAIGAAAAVILVVLAPAAGKTWEVRPGEDYRQAIPQLRPGDELVLHEGTYEGPAVVAVSGLPGKPITIRGHGNGQRRPVLRWEGRGANLWAVQGNHLVIRYLEFVPARVYAIRIGGAGKGGKDITIEDCVFRDCGGGCLSANHGGVRYEDIRVRDNQFLGARATPVYIGEHGGQTEVARFVFERNLVDGSRITAEGIVGYGIQFKLNVRGSVIRHNLITGAKGPGIMVYGAERARPEDANVVEGNVVVGARQSAGIVVGGGPAVVRHNVVAGCRAGGISLQDYGGRGLMDGITLSGNTCAANAAYGLSFRGLRAASRDVAVARNLVLSRPGVPGHLPPAAAPTWWTFPGAPGGPVSGNRALEADAALAAAVARLDGLIPEMAALRQAWPRLDAGPLDAAELVGLLESLRR